MIRTQVKVKNLQILDNYNNRIGMADQKLKGLSIYAANLLKAKASAKIKAELGPKASHFTVEIVPAGIVTQIVLRPVNEKGTFLFYGAKRHSYSSSRPMPIGDGRFAYRVDHPGFEGKRKEIEKAMREAVEETRREIRGVIARGVI